MPALTTLQIQMCRADIGDNDEPFDVSDVMLQALYDDPTLADSSLMLLRMYALRQLVGLSVNDIDDSGNVTGINSRSSQKHDHYVELLAYWESANGQSAGQSAGQSSFTPRRGDACRENRVFGWQADARVYGRWNSVDD